MTWGDDIAAKLIGASVPAGFQDCVAVWETPPAPCQLISLEDLKTALGITDSTQDTELTRLIGVYSQSIENYLERQMCSAAREAVYVPRSTCRVKTLQVPQWPIVSVESLDVDGTVLDAADYIENGMTGLIYPAASPGWTVNRYILVKYTAGYDPIPADLQNAMVDLCGAALSAGAGSGGTETGPLKSMRVEGAVTEQYYDSRTTSSTSTSSSGAEDIGKYYSVLDYYRSERAFI